MTWYIPVSRKFFFRVNQTHSKNNFLFFILFLTLLTRSVFHLAFKSSLPFIFILHLLLSPLILCVSSPMYDVAQVAKAAIIVGDPSYFPANMTRKVGTVVRSICLLNHAIKGSYLREHVFVHVV